MDEHQVQTQQVLCVLGCFEVQQWAFWWDVAVLETDKNKLDFEKKKHNFQQVNKLLYLLWAALCG